jgi:hypothetical protein
MKAEINLNDTIRVRLTELGYEVWAAERRMYSLDKEPIMIDALKAKASLNGTHSFQLHHFIRIFGSSIGLGREPVTKNNDIILLP